MNQAQRNFLVEKIQGGVQDRVRALKDGVPEYPNIVNYIYHKIMSNDFDIRPKEDLKKQVLDRAINATDRKDWNTTTGGHSWDKGRDIAFRIKDFFVIPPEFQEQLDTYHEARDRIDKEINLINSQADTLIVRIKLASNYTLESMIKEVDDMGDVKLMDTKLKALTS